MGVELEKSALESAALQYTSVETEGGDALRSKAESSEIAMRRVLRFVLWGLISVVADPEENSDLHRESSALLAANSCPFLAVAPSHLVFPRFMICL